MNDVFIHKSLFLNEVAIHRKASPFEWDFTEGSICQSSKATLIALYFLLSCVTISQYPTPIKTTQIGIPIPEFKQVLAGFSSCLGAISLVDACPAIIDNKWVGCKASKHASLAQHCEGFRIPSSAIVPP